MAKSNNMARKIAGVATWVKLDTRPTSEDADSTTLALIVERCHHAINNYGLEIYDDPNAPILLLTTYAATNPDSPYRRS